MAHLGGHDGQRMGYVDVIRFYFKNGRWRVTSGKRPVNARDWWNAINQVKCMNHKLRTAAAPQRHF